MKYTPLYLLAVVLACAPIASNADSVSSDDVRQALNRADRKLIHSVRDYVRNTRGWMDGDYRVDFYRYEGDLAVFYVWYEHNDGPSNLVYNNGRSFRVVVNPRTQKVESEHYF